MKQTAYHGSVHTHSTFCDGKNTMAEMAAAACAAGVKHYGFSGHIHTPAPSDISVCAASGSGSARCAVPVLPAVQRSPNET